MIRSLEPMMSSRSVAMLATVFVTVVGAACTTGSSASDPSAPATTVAASEAAWEKVVPGDGCECADGSEFAFWAREADPTKVVLFLDGGGVCWDPTTCAFTTDAESTTYDWNISPDDDPALEGGIFDQSKAANPFAGYSFVYVPYCTGDVHLGNVSREYSPELTVEHKGFLNASAALSFLAEHHPDAEQVVVVGESAGSVAAPVYAGLASDALPDARIIVLGDSSGAYPDDPDVNTEILGRWGTFETMPDWEVNEGLTATEWGVPRFWIQAGLHDPAIVMARFDYAHDENQTSLMERVGLDASNLVVSIDANDAAIEEAGVVRHSYTAPGNDHGIVGDGAFYRMEVNGVSLVEWVGALIAGEPLDDVHCDDCEQVASVATVDEGGEPPDDETTAELAELTAVAECMRAKGYEMADPTVDDQGRVMLRPPVGGGDGEDEIDEQDAAFQACAQAVALEPPATTAAD